MRLKRLLFGYDFFISYSRMDTSEYASNLANKIIAAGYSCYLDQWGSDPGKELPKGLKNKIKNSSVLILLASDASIGSKAVGQEIDVFLPTKRVIIPVDFGNISSASWFQKIDGIALSNESKDNINQKNPSETLLNRAINSFTYIKQSKRIQYSGVSSFLLITISIIFSLFIVNSLNRKIGKATNDINAKQLISKALDVERIDPTEAITLVDSAVRLSNNKTNKDFLTQMYSRNIFYKKIGDEREVARFFGNKILIDSTDSSLHIHNVENNSLSKIDLGFKKNIEFVQLSKDGNFIICSTKQRLVIYDTQANINVYDKKIDSDLTTIEFSIDKKYLFVGHKNGKVSVINMSDFKIFKVIQCQTGPIHEIDFSPCRRFFITSSGSYYSSREYNPDTDGPIRIPEVDKYKNVYDSESLEKYGFLDKTHSFEDYSDTWGGHIISHKIDFASDRTILINSINSIIKYNYSYEFDGNRMSFKLYNQKILAEADKQFKLNKFSHTLMDNHKNYLITSQLRNSNIDIYDIKNELLLYTLKSSSSSNQSVSISSESNHIISKSSSDNHFKVWQTQEIFPSEIFPLNILKSIPQKSYSSGLSWTSGVREIRVDASKDGRHFIAALDGRLIEIERKSNEVTKIFKGIPDDVLKISYFKDKNDSIQYVFSEGDKNILWINENESYDMKEAIISDNKELLLLLNDSSTSVRRLNYERVFYTDKLLYKDKILNFYFSKDEPIFIIKEKKEIVIKKENEEALIKIKVDSLLTTKVIVNDSNILLKTSLDSLAIIHKEDFSIIKKKTDNFFSSQSGKINVLYVDKQLLVCNEHFSHFQTIKFFVGINDFELKITEDDKYIILTNQTDDFIPFYKIRDSIPLF